MKHRNVHKWDAETNCAWIKLFWGAGREGFGKGEEGGRALKFLFNIQASLIQKNWKTGRNATSVDGRERKKGGW